MLYTVLLLHGILKSFFHIVYFAVVVVGSWQVSALDVHSSSVVL